MAARHEITARVRKLRPVFYQVGMLTALLLTLGAFKWTVEGETVYVREEVAPDTTAYDLGEIRIIEYQNEEIVAKTEKLEQPNPDPNQLKIVDNDKVIKTIDETQKVITTDWTEVFNRKPPVIDEGPEEFSDGAPIWIPSKYPEFVGGDEARSKFFQKNYIVPAIVLETATKGTISITLKCVIEKDGSVSNIEILKDGGYPEAAEEFAKVAAKMPRWNPGYQGAHAVRVFVSIPFKIRINK
jgi:hypothetical protein